MQEENKQYMREKCGLCFKKKKKKFEKLVKRSVNKSGT